MLTSDIKATEARIKELEVRHVMELNDVIANKPAGTSRAEPEAYRAAARAVAHMTSVEIEKEKHRLIDQLYARVRELEEQIPAHGVAAAAD